MSTDDRSADTPDETETTMSSTENDTDGTTRPLGPVGTGTTTQPVTEPVTEPVATPEPVDRPSAWTDPAATTEATPATASTPDRGLRVGTVVWGLVVAAVGVGLLALGLGAVFDVELAVIGLVAVAGLALLAGSVAGAVRRRG